MAGEPTTVRGKYIGATVVFVVVAVPLGILIANTSPVTVTTVEGIAAFAILYVLAQAIERINQLTVPLLDWVLSKFGNTQSATTNKREALSSLRATRALLMSPNITLAATESGPAATATAQDEAAVTTADKEKALLTNGLAFFLAMLAVGTFKFSLLASLGYTSVPSIVDLTITATAIMGGSAGLSDLISKVQKSKTANETGTG